MSNKIYTGIGSRETPEPILNTMKAIGSAFAKVGFILRSGGADGADTAFEIGCNHEQGQKEIYLPWKKFNRNQSHLFLPENLDSPIIEGIVEISKQYHPNWERLSQGGQRMMIRNYFQIFGNNDIQSDFVVCWTPEGKIKGGTGQALRLANAYNIKIYNLFFDRDLNELRSFYQGYSAI